MTSQNATPTKRGRPRTFDHEQLLQNSVDIFWRYGQGGATTRVLEEELGISQSSLYNAYGSKDELLKQSVARYAANLQATVLSHLETPSRESLLDFVDAVLRWVSDDEHRGCLVMNLAVENKGQGYRLEAYRQGLFEAFTASLQTFMTDDAAIEANADLLVVAVLGMNVSAKCGAEASELQRIASGIKRHINAW